MASPKKPANDKEALQLRSLVQPLEEGKSDLGFIADWVGDAQIVLLGEASHGTREFYELRAALTRRLIEEHHFNAVAVEADWPDAYQVNRYVMGLDQSRDADDALSGFKRFPQWMWRNRVVLEFVDWLRAHNAPQADPRLKTGFYGLDLYSLHQSIQAVLGYLQTVDPEAAQAARASYGCFERYDHDTQSYAWAARQLGESLCEEAVVKQLLQLRAREDEYREIDGREAEEEYFSAEQNARLARNAELYYRTMFQGRVASWNLRDRHMAETLDELVAHLGESGQSPKVVVWAHNSHIGDARATEVSSQGELNLGQLVRERYGDRAKLVGFTTYTGAVTAASDWGEPAEHKQVRSALAGSYEEFFHQMGWPGFFLPLRGSGAIPSGLLPERRLERAIGVVYRPETERWSHYLNAKIAEQFDAVIHLDKTSALEPLERNPGWSTEEVPETFPSGV